MTAFDPSLDQSQKPAVGLTLDPGEVALLRHDLDRALGAVLAGLSGVAAADLDARTRELLDQASASARTMTGLVRVMRGEPAATEEIAVEKLVSRVRAVHAADARARGLVFATLVDKDAPPSLRVDQMALVRILDNLLDNALRYSAAGTVTFAVSRNAGGEIVFRITDDGPGVGSGLGSGVGAPVQVDGPRGLDVVRVLAERLGASASIGDRAGGGTEAVLRLPASGAVGNGGTRLAGARLLLAEDNLTNQMVALQMLRALGACVTICSDGIEALERFDEGTFDLVIVDIEMPRMSGLDVIRAIRARGDEKARIPIVALTAYAMHEHRERIAAAGANGLISKPVTSVEALGEGLAPHVRHPAASSAPGGADLSPGGEGTSDERDPVIDAATYAALCEAIGPELIAELLDKVITDLLAAQRDLLGGCAPIDRLAIRGASHILISVAGALGALRLQTRARALNASAHTEAETVLTVAVAGCAAEIELAVAFARERRAAL